MIGILLVGGLLTMIDMFVDVLVKTKVIYILFTLGVLLFIKMIQWMIKTMWLQFVQVLYYACYAILCCYIFVEDTTHIILKTLMIKTGRLVMDT
jgi:hypothetical protein